MHIVIGGDGRALQIGNEIDFVSAKPKCPRTEQHPVNCIMPASPDFETHPGGRASKHPRWAKGRGQCGRRFRRCHNICQGRNWALGPPLGPCLYPHSNSRMADVQGWRICDQVRLRTAVRLDPLHETHQFLSFTPTRATISRRFSRSGPFREIAPILGVRVV